MRPISNDPVASFRIAVSLRNSCNETVGSILQPLVRDFRDGLGCELETVLLLEPGMAFPDWIGQQENVSCEMVHNRFWHRILGSNKPIRETIRRSNPDVLLAFDEFIESVDCPQIVFHSSDPASTQQNRSALQALQHATANVFDSQELHEALLERHSVTRPDQYHVVHFNGQIRLSPHLLASDKNPQAFAEASNAHSSEVLPSQVDRITPKVAVLVGNDPRSQLDWLGKVMNGVCASDTQANWSAVVVGHVEDSIRQQFELAMGDLNPSWGLAWVDDSSPQIVGDLLENCTCLLTCQSDDLGVDHALLAMQNRCPVVACDCKQNQAQLQDSAVLCRASDLDGWVDAIETLFCDGEVRRDFIDFGLAHAPQLDWRNRSFAFSEILYHATGRAVTPASD